jgi:hypothetical protein
MQRNSTIMWPFILRIYLLAPLVFAFLASSGGVFTAVVAWLPPPTNAFKNSFTKEVLFSEPPATQCCSHKSDPDGDSKIILSPSLSNSIRSVLVTTAFLTASWWCSSIPIMTSFDANHVNVNMVAQAKEMASGSGSRVNKDPESLLRYGLPIDNKEVSHNSCVFQQL